jgi:YbbR domain-containing protein
VTAHRPPGRRWQDNWGLKALSVMLAAGVWLYVNSQGQVTVNFAVPIEVVNLSADLVMADMAEETADVRVKGRESTLARVSSRHIHAYLDLAAATPGEQWVTLNPSDIKIAQPVEVTRVSPRQVRVRIEPRLTKAVKVVADVIGKPAPGRTVSRIVVDPPAVKLTGAESAFEGLTALPTQPVDVSGLAESVRREVRLDLRGRDLEFLEPHPLYVTINIGPGAGTEAAPAR